MRIARNMVQLLQRQTLKFVSRATALNSQELNPTYYKIQGVIYMITISVDSQQD